MRRLSSLVKGRSEFLYRDARDSFENLPQTSAHLPPAGCVDINVDGGDSRCEDWQLGGFLCEINYNTEGELVPLCSQMWVVRVRAQPPIRVTSDQAGTGETQLSHAPGEGAAELHSLDLGTYRMAGRPKTLGHGHV